MHLTDTCDPQFEKIFSQAGVTTIRVPPFDPRHPHSNKLSQLNTERLQEYDVIVLSDCDIAFSQDIPRILADTNAVSAKPVDNANLAPKQWQTIYAQAGFPSPELNVMATIDRQPTLPLYFNGGLYVLPQHVFKLLRTVWPKWNRWMLDNRALLEPFAMFTDQVSFALSLQEIGCPVTPLSIAYNCPTHMPFPEGFPIEEPPKVLHYHNQLNSSGFLLPTSQETINRSIAVVNDLIRQRRQKSFDNSIFWQFRYGFDPECGFGVGSRGDNLLIKRNLLRTEIKRMRPHSILDVGCGDLDRSSGCGTRAGLRSGHGKPEERRGCEQRDKTTIRQRHG